MGYDILNETAIPLLGTGQQNKFKDQIAKVDLWIEEIGTIDQFSGFQDDLNTPEKDIIVPDNLNVVATPEVADRIFSRHQFYK